MLYFRNRLDPDYHAHLDQVMSLDGTDGLVSTAEPLANPIHEAGTTFTRIVSIDFQGLSASVLFDVSESYSAHCIHSGLKALAGRIGELNENGIIARVRILLLYPYSTAGIVHVQADTSTRRPAINEPEFSRGIRLMSNPADDDIKASALWSQQRHTIEVLEEWTAELGARHILFRHPNRVSLRYCLVDPRFCALRVNQWLYFDTYLFAKRHRHDPKTTTDVSSLIALKRGPDDEYNYVYDHFRYLWELDSTLDSDDVIKMDDGVPHLVRPREVSIETKKERALHSFEPKPTPEQLIHYERRLRELVSRLCAPVSPSQGSEFVFVACSWRRPAGGEAQPNIDAQSVRTMLNNDFGGAVAEGQRIGVLLLDEKVGNQLTPALYGALGLSTLGIIVLSPEYETEEGERPFICKPNVYHEFGYLMARLAKGRTVVFVERRVSIPSNVNDLIRIDYDEGKIDLGYWHILLKMYDLGLVSAREVNGITDVYVQHLRERVVNGELTAEEVKHVEGLIGTYIRCLRD